MKGLLFLGSSIILPPFFDNIINLIYCYPTFLKVVVSTISSRVPTVNANIWLDCIQSTYINLYATFSNFISTLKRSPSIIISNFPPWSMVKDFAIESPSPLPSVVLDTSPLTNLSVSSSGLIFNGFSDIFFYNKCCSRIVRNNININSWVLCGIFKCIYCKGFPKLSKDVFRRPLSLLRLKEYLK